MHRTSACSLLWTELCSYSLANVATYSGVAMHVYKGPDHEILTLGAIMLSQLVGPLLHGEHIIMY